MKTLGYGIIGTGRISVNHLDAIEQVEGARVVALTDQDGAKAHQDAAGRKTAPAVHPGWQTLLRDPAVEVVVICVPPQCHAEVVAAAARAGKHIYCEKPMAPTLQECHEMSTAAETAGVRLAIGQSMRFFPAFAQARRLLDEAGCRCGLSGKLHLSPCCPAVCKGGERRIADGLSRLPLVSAIVQ